MLAMPNHHSPLPLGGFAPFSRLFARGSDDQQHIRSSSNPFLASICIQRSVALLISLNVHHPYINDFTHGEHQRHKSLTSSVNILPRPRGMIEQDHDINIAVGQVVAPRDGTVQNYAAKMRAVRLRKAVLDFLKKRSRSHGSDPLEARAWMHQLSAECFGVAAFPPRVRANTPTEPAVTCRANGDSLRRHIRVAF